MVRVPRTRMFPLHNALPAVDETLVRGRPLGTMRKVQAKEVTGYTAPHALEVACVLSSILIRGSPLQQSPAACKMNVNYCTGGSTVSQAAVLRSSKGPFYTARSFLQKIAIAAPSSTEFSILTIVIARNRVPPPPPKHRRLLHNRRPTCEPHPPTI